jgi:hypothetical protein
MRPEWEPEELVSCRTLVDADWELVANKAGATRLGFALPLKFFELEALEREGLVARAASDSDRRVVFAQLTPAGRRRLPPRGAAHHRDIEALFAARFGADELQALDALLARLPGAEDAAGWAASTR